MLLCWQASLPVGSSGALQLVAADISQRKTLTPDMFKGVCGVVSCTAVKVQPKEGDTADRAKYYQVHHDGVAPATAALWTSCAETNIILCTCIELPVLRCPSVEAVDQERWKPLQLVLF